MTMAVTLAEPLARAIETRVLGVDAAVVEPVGSWVDARADA